MEMISTIIEVGLDQIKCNVVSRTHGEGLPVGGVVNKATVQVGSTYLFLDRSELLTLRSELNKVLDGERKP